MCQNEKDTPGVITVSVHFFIKAISVKVSHSLYQSERQQLRSGPMVQPHIVHSYLVRMVSTSISHLR